MGSDKSESIKSLRNSSEKTLEEMNNSIVEEEFGSRSKNSGELSPISSKSKNTLPASLSEDYNIDIAHINDSSQIDQLSFISDLDDIPPIRKSLNLSKAVKGMDDVHSQKSSRDSLDSSVHKKKLLHKLKDGKSKSTLVPSSSSFVSLLGGKSLGYFNQNHPLRLYLAAFFHNPLTKIFINFLILLNWLLLVIQHWEPSHRVNKFGETKSDYGILVIQVFYILELVGKVIIFGFIKNPPPIQRKGRTREETEELEDLMARNIQGVSGQFIPHLSYFNDPLNKIDFIAISSYWIDLILVLAIPNNQIYYFKILSTIRPIRLLLTTKSVSVIIQSLINSKSVLINILFFLVYFFIIFALLGRLLFDGKLRGRCFLADNKTLVYPLRFCIGHYLDKSQSFSKVDYLNGQALPWTDGYICKFNQICKDIGNPWGGYYGFDNFLSSLLIMYQIAMMQKWSHLMYILMEVDSWGIILFFLITILVLNYWLFTLFVAVITRMFGKTKEDNVRLMALISRRSAKLEQSVQDQASWDIKVEARKEHMDIFNSGLDYDAIWSVMLKSINHSRYIFYKYTGKGEDNNIDDDDFNLTWEQIREKLMINRMFAPVKRNVKASNGRVGTKLKHYGINRLAPWIGVIKFIGRILIIIELICLCTITPSSMVSFGIIGLFTLFFDIEVLLRVGIKLSTCNTANQIPITFEDKFDMLLEFLNTIIALIPPQALGIFDHSLTFFSILRFYRLLAFLPSVRNLLKIVGSRYKGIFDLGLFIILSFLTCIPMGMMLLGGVAPKFSIYEPVDMNFDNFKNSALSLVQIFSGEDWGQLMYRYMDSVGNIPMAVLIALFVVVWSGFATFVMLNLFIAITMEGFEIVEHSKKSEQVSSYVDSVSKLNLEDSNVDLQSRLRILIPSQFNNYSRIGPLPNNVSLSLPVDVQKEHFGKSTVNQIKSFGDLFALKGCLGWLKGMVTNNYDLLKLESSIKSPSSVASTIHDLKSNSRMSTTGSESMNKDDSVITYETGGQSIVPQIDKGSSSREMIAEFIKLEFPIRTWLIFGFKHKWRRFCCWLLKDDPEIQKLNDSQSSANPTNKLWSLTPFNIFDTLMWLINLINVILAALDTPYSAKTNSDSYTLTIQVLTLIITLIFTLEFFIVTSAIGFCFTDNSYLKQAWKRIDFFVLILMWIDVFVSLGNPSYHTRLYFAVKSFRTLRLVTLSPILQNTIYTLFVSGFRGILDVVIFLLFFAIPYSIYGYLLFADLLMRCNAEDVQFMEQCQGLFISPESGILVSKVWSNPENFNFDTLASSLVLHLEILSRERWIHVMGIAMDIMGPGIQPVQDASWYTSLYFVAYFMFGSIFVLTLFITVVIENYRRFTGVSLLTADQRRYIDLKKQISSVNPSKHPPTVPTGKYQKLCYELSIEKHGVLHNTTAILLLLIALFSMMQYQGQSPTYKIILNVFTLLCTLGLIVEIPIVWVGLGPRNFWAKRCNVIYYVVLIITTIVNIFEVGFNASFTVEFIGRICQTVLLLKLIVKSDRLLQLANILVASSKDLLNFFMVVGTVMLFFSILLEQCFGLTRLGPNGSEYINFRNWINSFILILKMTTGEDWNEIMHDYTVQYPHCIIGKTFLDSDCGSKSLAYIIFLAYNVISMYILMNMLIVLVLENFSFCYDITASFDLLTRDEIRRFKGLWKQIDPNMTGKVNAEKIIKIMKAEGNYLDCKLYPQNLQVYSLLSEYSMIKKTKWTVPARIEVDGKLVKLQLQSTKLKKGGKWMLDAIPNDEIIEYMVWVQNKVTNANWASRIRNGTFNLCRRKFNITYYQFQFLTEDHSKDDGEIGDITYSGSHRDLARNPISIHDCLKLICQVNLIEPENCFLIDELLEYKTWYSRHIFRYQHELLLGLVKSYLGRKHFKMVLDISNGMMDFGVSNRASQMDVSHLIPVALSRDASVSLGSSISRQLSNQSSNQSRIEIKVRSVQMENAPTNVSEAMSISSQQESDGYKTFNTCHWNNILKVCDEDDLCITDGDSLYDDDDFIMDNDEFEIEKSSKMEDYEDDYEIQDSSNILSNATGANGVDDSFISALENTSSDVNNTSELLLSSAQSPAKSEIPDIQISEFKQINGRIDRLNFNDDDDDSYEYDEGMSLEEGPMGDRSRTKKNDDDIAYESDDN